MENLKEYEQQLDAVGRLLLQEPNNEELLAIYDDLTEVVQLTRELLAQPRDAVSQQLVAPQATVAPADGTTGLLLPPQMANQIRHAQQRAALAGQGPADWAVGARCQAVHSGDGNWYDAVVESVTSTGRYVVVFDGYDSREEVGKDDVQLCATQNEGGYKGVSAPKQRRVDDGAEVEDMPKWLEVKATDDDKTRQKKRKLAKAYKSKARFARLDSQQKQKADAWKRFLAGKAPKTTKTKR